MSDHNHETDGNPGWWIARPENANKVWTALIVACISLVLVDLIYHNFVHEKYAYFAFETIIGFHGFYGLVAFMFVVICGKQLRTILMRDENYYEPDHLDEHQKNLAQEEDAH